MFVSKANELTPLFFGTAFVAEGFFLHVYNDSFLVVFFLAFALMYQYILFIDSDVKTGSDWSLQGTKLHLL